MANNSTWRRRTGAVLGALGVGAVAVIVGLAGPADAHAPKVSAKCADGKTVLKVELSRYNPAKANTVKITDGDKSLGDTEFQTDFKKSWEVAGDVDHNFVVTVVAWDDPDGRKNFSFTEKLPVKACVTPPTTTTTKPSESTPATTTSESTPATTTSEEEAPLANTGASIALPIGIGALLLVGGILLVVLRRRGRA